MAYQKAIIDDLMSILFVHCDKEYSEFYVHQASISPIRIGWAKLPIDKQNQVALAKLQWKWACSMISLSLLQIEQILLIALSFSLRSN